MIVWAVTRYVPYEADDLISVNRTRKGAEKAAQKHYFVASLGWFSKPLVFAPTGGAGDATFRAPTDTDTVYFVQRWSVRS